MKIWYLPLEPYRERYTEALAGWTLEAFDEDESGNVTVINGQHFNAQVTVGRVLDAYGRGYWACTQIANLIAMLSGNPWPDVIYIDDMFHPGYEALPYLFAQETGKGKAPVIVTRNFAQSMDPDDFTHPMRSWMRHYEHVVYKTADVVLCACSEHERMIRAAGLEGRTEALGLPFNDAWVRRTYGMEQRDRLERPFKVIYASRFDTEKQPQYFLELARRCRVRSCGYEFVMCTGADDVRSNDPCIVEAIKRAESDGLVRVMRGCTKASYYHELATSRVQVNTARQDFISYTALEASALGTQTLAPAFRSFPEAFDNDARCLWVPWSVDDLEAKLINLMTMRRSTRRIKALAAYHGQTLARTYDLFETLVN